MFLEIELMKLKFAQRCNITFFLVTNLQFDDVTTTSVDFDINVTII
jgi:hypothetical protein